MQPMHKIPGSPCIEIPTDKYWNDKKGIWNMFRAVEIDPTDPEDGDMATTHYKNPLSVGPRYLPKERYKLSDREIQVGTITVHSEYVRVYRQFDPSHPLPKKRAINAGEKVASLFAKVFEVIK